MSDWDQSGRLFFRGGRSVLGKHLSLQDLLLGTFCLLERSSPSVFTGAAAPPPGLADCCQSSLVQTGPDFPGRSGTARLSWHGHIMLLKLISGAAL